MWVSERFEHVRPALKKKKERVPLLLLQSCVSCGLQRTSWISRPETITKKSHKGQKVFCWCGRKWSGFSFGKSESIRSASIMDIIKTLRRGLRPSSKKSIKYDPTVGVSSMGVSPHSSPLLTLKTRFLHGTNSRPESPAMARLTSRPPRPPNEQQILASNPQSNAGSRESIYGKKDAIAIRFSFHYLENWHRVYWLLILSMSFSNDFSGGLIHHLLWW